MSLVSGFELRKESLHYLHQAEHAFQSMWGTELVCGQLL